MISEKEKEKEKEKQGALSKKIPLELQEEILLIREYPLLRSILKIVPDVVLVINDKREIIFANDAILNFPPIREIHKIYGLKLGNALNCAHADLTEGGCGTTEFCKMCGGNISVESGFNRNSDAQECRILAKNGDALDLHIRTEPMILNNKNFTIFVIKDISHEKRRKALERIFFHDVINTAGNLLNVSDLLSDTANSEKEMSDYKKMLTRLSESLLDEINTHRDLSLAENNELKVYPVRINTLDLLEQVRDSFLAMAEGKKKKLLLDPKALESEMLCDKTILKRILGNMTKNALEATAPNKIVTLGANLIGNEVEFWVHNPNHMPRQVQLQVFQRSFSTKGSGRGLGTYSIKLLTERYLKGRATFSSDRAHGTTFQIFLPL
jgi:hypothetical protein